MIIDADDRRTLTAAHGASTIIRVDPAGRLTPHRSGVQDRTTAAEGSDAVDLAEDELADRIRRRRIRSRRFAVGGVALTATAVIAGRFRFLVDEAGFTAMRVDAPAHDRRPRSLRVAYVSTGARVEVTLDHPFGGEESVSTLLETGTGRWDFGPNVAHKGHAMRKALTAQAQQVAEVLRRLETERA